MISIRCNDICPPLTITLLPVMSFSVSFASEENLGVPLHAFDQSTSNSCGKYGGLSSVVKSHFRPLSLCPLCFNLFLSSFFYPLLIRPRFYDVG